MRATGGIGGSAGSLVETRSRSRRKLATAFLRTFTSSSSSESGCATRDGGETGCTGPARYRTQSCVSSQEAPANAATIGFPK